MKIIQYPIIRKFAPILLGAAILLFLPHSSSAAAYAKYDGIDGESTEIHHPKWIDVLSVAWGAHNQGGQTRRRGSVVIEDLALTLTYDKAAVALQKKCIEGAIIPSLVIDLAMYGDGRQQPYLKFELTNVLISSFQLAAAAEGATTALEVTMSFDNMKQTYSLQNGDGSVTPIDLSVKQKGKF